MKEKMYWEPQCENQVYMHWGLWKSVGGRGLINKGKLHQWMASKLYTISMPSGTGWNQLIYFVRIIKIQVFGMRKEKGKWSWAQMLL